ncbi:hypothetical protein CEXT_809361 [Caerostris extrusa]|uniref:Uncharacterized protein n=1 Tax=Caerostris extrusa TaxID=172846 RepID=A0AAV4T1R6_CAEEX|nr:hypothetical protein CEXT_809361 [Caerostris extrusa]
MDRDNIPRTADITFQKDFQGYVHLRNTWKKPRKLLDACAICYNYCLKADVCHEHGDRRTTIGCSGMLADSDPLINPAGVSSCPASDLSPPCGSTTPLHRRLPQHTTHSCCLYFSLSVTCPCVRACVYICVRKGLHFVLNGAAQGCLFTQGQL